MIAIERSPERDAVIRAALPIAASRGWTEATLRAATAAAGFEPALAASFFPRGAIGAIEAWSDLADREMEAAAAADPAFAALGTSGRIRRLIALRLAAVAPHQAALRRALARLALPWNAPVVARCTARTVDAMWYAAGDSSADISWYTKRGSLAAIYAATLAFWLRDAEPDTEAALAFLDRRLADLARAGQLRRRLATPLRDRAATG